VSDWQPIETAAKERSVIVWEDGVMGEAYFDSEDETWWWENTSRHDYHARAVYPSLWHPMPSPPSCPIKDRQLRRISR